MSTLIIYTTYMKHIKVHFYNFVRYFFILIRKMLPFKYEGINMLQHVYNLLKQKTKSRFYQLRIGGKVSNFSINSVDYFLNF